MKNLVVAILLVLAFCAALMYNEHRRMVADLERMKANPGWSRAASERD